MNGDAMCVPGKSRTLLDYDGYLYLRLYAIYKSENIPDRFDLVIQIPL